MGYDWASLGYHSGPCVGWIILFYYWELVVIMSGFALGILIGFLAFPAFALIYSWLMKGH